MRKVRPLRTAVLDFLFTSPYAPQLGFSLKTTTQAGVKVTRPDFFVVRLSLLGLEDCARSRHFVEAALKATASRCAAVKVRLEAQF